MVDYIDKNLFLILRGREDLFHEFDKWVLAQHPEGISINDLFNESVYMEGALVINNNRSNACQPIGYIFHSLQMFRHLCVDILHKYDTREAMAKHCDMAWECKAWSLWENYTRENRANSIKYCAYLVDRINDIVMLNLLDEMHYKIERLIREAG